MQILMLLASEYPTDNRVEKEIESLIKDGHQVDLACYTRTGKVLREEFEGYTVYRSPISKLMYKLSAAILIFPFFFNYWKRFTNQLFKESKYDAVHVHDLPLAKIGYYLKQKYNVALVCDQHEYYSNWIIHTSLYNSGSGRIIKLLSNWKKYEKKYLNKADLVITVEEPLRECYIKDVKVPPERLILVPNTPELKVFDVSNVNPKIIEKYKNDFVIYYAGGIDKLRGLDMVIESLSIIRKVIPNVKFVIAGKEAKGFSIMNLAEQFGVAENVEFLKWIDHDVIPSYMAAAKVGVFTPPGNRDEIHNTIATKIYQYAAMGIPMIVSNVKLMKQFVEEHKIGYAVNNTKEFAEAVLALYENQNTWQEFHENCKNVRDKYVWDYTIQNMLNFYNSYS